MSYLEDPSPGYGALPARAAFRSDARSLGLAGSWRFHLAPGGRRAGGIERRRLRRRGLAGAGGAVELAAARHGAPAYTNVAYPFPVEPPRCLPRTRPGLPAALRPRRRVAGRARVLRFDGVDSCARIWLNGRELASPGQPAAAESDVTGLLRAGRTARLPRAPVVLRQLPRDQDMCGCSGIFGPYCSAAGGGIADYWVAPTTTPRRHRHPAGRGPGAPALVPELGSPTGGNRPIAIDAVSRGAPTAPALRRDAGDPGGTGRAADRSARWPSRRLLTVNGRRCCSGRQRHEHTRSTARALPPGTALATFC